MPNIHGKGDYGVTKTLDGKFVDKDDDIIVASGKLDTLCSSIYFAKYYNHEKYATIFDEIEKNLTHLLMEVSWDTKLIELSEGMDWVLIIDGDERNKKANGGVRTLYETDDAFQKRFAQEMATRGVDYPLPQQYSSIKI